MKLIYTCYFSVAFLNGYTVYFFLDHCYFSFRFISSFSLCPTYFGLNLLSWECSFFFLLVKPLSLLLLYFSCTFALRIFTYPLNDGSHITASEKTFFNFQTRSCLSIRYLLIPCTLKKVQFQEQTWEKSTLKAES